MKNILSLTVLILAATMLFGQQDPQFTQFMYNKMGYNPGYAGSNDGVAFTALVRQQWLGLEGAPGSQLISFNMPLQDERVGIGASVWRTNIGINEMVNLEGDYAYRVELGEGRLGLGVMGSVRYLSSDFAMTDPLQAGDNSIPVGMQSKYVPNFGVGLYYGTDQYFFGVSAPRLLENNIDFADEDLILSTEIRHFYGMAGGLLKLSETTQLQPQILIKYAQNAPIDADINVNLILLNKYMVGASYRFGGTSDVGIAESIDFLLGAQISEKLMIGFAYDVTLSELRTYQNGTVEAMLRYVLPYESNNTGEYLNPRFF